MAGTVINEYLSPNELRDLRNQYLEEALSFLSNYRSTDDPLFILDSGGIEVGTIRPADLEPDLYPVAIDYLSNRL
jgi:hypothetical protein